MDLLFVLCIKIKDKIDVQNYKNKLNLFLCIPAVVEGQLIRLFRYVRAFMCYSGKLFVDHILVETFLKAIFIWCCKYRSFSLNIHVVIWFAFRFGINYCNAKI